MDVGRDAAALLGHGDRRECPPGLVHLGDQAGEQRQAVEHHRDGHGRDRAHDEDDAEGLGLHRHEDQQFTQDDGGEHRPGRPAAGDRAEGRRRREGDQAVDEFDLGADQGYVRQRRLEGDRPQDVPEPRPAAPGEEVAHVESHDGQHDGAADQVGPVRPHRCEEQRSEHVHGQSAEDDGQREPGGHVGPRYRLRLCRGSLPSPLGGVPRHRRDLGRAPPVGQADDGRQRRTEDGVEVAGDALALVGHGLRGQFPAGRVQFAAQVAEPGQAEDDQTHHQRVPRGAHAGVEVGGGEQARRDADGAERGPADTAGDDEQHGGGQEPLRLAPREQRGLGRERPPAAQSFRPRQAVHELEGERQEPGRGRLDDEYGGGHPQEGDDEDRHGSPP